MPEAVVWFLLHGHLEPAEVVVAPVSDVDGADDSGELVGCEVGVVVPVGVVLREGSGEVDVSVSGIGVRLQRDSGSSGPGR